MNEQQLEGLDLEALFNGRKEITSLEEHALLLGKLVSNFQVLETLLRVTLLELAPEEHADAQIDFEGMPENTWLKETPFTNFHTLKTLLANFNEQMKNLGGVQVPDEREIVEWRNAIAHGRTVGGRHGSDLPLRLIKCSKSPDKETNEHSSCVKLEVNQLMTQQWFKRRIQGSKHAIDTVLAALRKAEERAQASPSS